MPLLLSVLQFLCLTGYITVSFWAHSTHVTCPFGNTVAAGHVTNLKSSLCNKDLGGQI